VAGGFATAGVSSAAGDAVAPDESDDAAGAVVVAVAGPATAKARAPVATTDVVPMATVRPQTARLAPLRVCRAWCPQHECGP
jgi:hypothetical protein